MSVSDPRPVLAATDSEHRKMTWRLTAEIEAVDTRELATRLMDLATEIDRGRIYHDSVGASPSSTYIVRMEELT